MRGWRDFRVVIYSVFIAHKLSTIYTLSVIHKCTQRFGICSAYKTFKKALNFMEFAVKTKVNKIRD
jgi:hypothetical protein